MTSLLMMSVPLSIPMALLSTAAPGVEQPGVVRREFVYETAPFPQCHASTIAETKHGLVAAWFGGTRERHADVGIWVARHDGKVWSPVTEVANGVENSTTRYPCWNPVLFQPARGPLLLFYKVGPNPRAWWGMLMTSPDGGKTWSRPRRLPDGILGPIKNKPIALDDGTLLCGSSTEHAGWRVHIERTSDLGATWTKTAALNSGVQFGIIQPTILRHDKRLRILCRSRQGRIVASWSEDGGKTWSRPEATSLPNPNSGIDGVTLRDGRQVLVYNHTRSGRSPLNLAVSRDGMHWRGAVVLEDEPGEYSYPAVIQTSDGLIHVSYTWRRTRVRHVVIDPSKWMVEERGTER